MKSLIAAAIVLATISTASAECRTDSECYMTAMGTAYNVESALFNMDNDDDNNLYITCEDGKTGKISESFDDILRTQKEMRDLCGKGEIEVDEFCMPYENGMAGWCGSYVQIMQYVEEGELNFDGYICGVDYDLGLEELRRKYPNATKIDNKMHTVEVTINGEVLVIDCFKF